MGNLKIIMNHQMNTTVVSNQFIDQYMLQANGEYVKIYLFVLRCVNHTDSSLSIKELAMRFDHTVSYILTALEYWEKVGLIRLRYDGKELQSIEFLDHFDTSDAQTAASETAATIADTSAASDVSGQITDDPYERRSYSADEKDRFLHDKDFEKASFVTQTYFKRLLGPSQLESLIFIYDQLGFDSEMIDYLIEYCTARGKRSMRYAEAVAIEWKKKGISTVAEAKSMTSLNSCVYYGVIKTFGISNRSLVEEERAFVDKWISSYRLSEELILEACRRTIRATGKPEFAYADSILKNWHSGGVQSMKDVALLDEKHQQRMSETGKNAKRRTSLRSSRNYDMEELEKQLISSGGSIS